MSHAVGSIVKARSREWVVLPGSTDSLVKVQPLGGNPEEITAILPAVETIESATFQPPDLNRPGDHKSAWLLRAAARIGNQNTAGPFRSLGKIRVEPRPYQYVPLLLGLRTDPVRLMIADDVGIGKTVEALLLARELMDRGEIERFCVLCPPHLAEQWVEEMRDKFHLDATLYLSKTAAKIHRNIPPGQSLFEHHPIIVASIDYVKQKGVRRDTFWRDAPDLIIVDEAHTCTVDSESQHLRYELIEGLSKADRHLVLVTATPHSGKEGAFRRLMTLLNKDFSDLPDDLQAEYRQKHRERLANHLVQRRRGDLAKYLDENTPFPEYKSFQGAYSLHPEARRLLEDMILTTRARYHDAKSKKEQRITWWSLLSMLRAFASSPAALVSTLEARSFVEDSSTEAEADRMGRESLLNDDDDDDAIRGASYDENLFLAWAKEAEGLLGAKDGKLKEAKKQIKSLLDDGRNIIVFCQFIETARYIGEELESLKANVTVVTGQMVPTERKKVVDEIDTTAPRILVATDCLSEGINLQDKFDAVFHYDLAWNPTRHEQRDGRVDRFNQLSDDVVSYTYYGKDNVVDGVVLKVLIDKHRKIRSSTGVSVPVPQDAADVEEAMMQTVLLKGDTTKLTTLSQFGAEIDASADVKSLHTRWDERAVQIKGSRTLFAHGGIKDEEVQAEIESARLALAREDVEAFFMRAMQSEGIGAKIHAKSGELLEIGTSGMTEDVKLSLGLEEDFTASFTKKPGVEHLHRTHPLIQRLTAFVLQTAIDDDFESPAARCGAAYMDVPAITNVYVLRFRYQLKVKGIDRLVEDIAVLGERGGQWLPEADVTALMSQNPTASFSSDTAKTEYIQDALDTYQSHQDAISAMAQERCEATLQVHRQVRDAVKTRHDKELLVGRIDMQPLGHPDLLGAYALVPGGN